MTTDILNTQREQTIIKTSLVGIVTNLCLAALKAAVGVLSHSIAVILDAVNNLSDVLSALITLIGAKLAGKKPDKKHPHGHGRIEYISSMLVSAIVLYAGITALIESIKKIFHPQLADYSPLSLIIIAAAVLVKLILSGYIKRQGKQVNSSALLATATDAFFDAILSASVLACAIIYILFHISLEAYLGIIISLVIMKAGWEMLSSPLNDILGQRADSKLSQQIKQIVREEPSIRGVYDLIINNYGPNKNYASLHIELPDTMTVDEVDRITRKLEEKVYHQTGIILTGVGIYSYNTHGGEAARLRNEIQQLVLAHNWALQLHGFYANVEEKTIRFDVVLNFDIARDQAQQILLKEVKQAYPAYQIQITLDIDACD